MFSTKQYSILTAAAALLLSSTAAQAAGFYLQESSVVGTGMAYAGKTTSINNAQTVYSNPAGMADLKGTQVSVGVQTLIPYAHLTDKGSTFGGPAVGGGSGGNPYEMTPLPNGYITHAINDKIAIGLGLTTPFGLAGDYGQTWFGRYDSTKTELQVIDLSPVMSYKVNQQLSVGGGLDIQRVTARLAHMATITGPITGTSVLKGDDTSVGYNLGVKFKPTSETTLGATYRSAITHNLSGNIMADLGPAAFVDEGTAKLKLPDILSIGIEQKINPRTRVMGSVSWYGWDRFDAIRPINTTTGTGLSSTGVPIPSVTENYKNTMSLAVGGEYDLTPVWTVRAGYQYDPTPTRSAYRDTLVPDGNRNYFGAGATYHVTPVSSLDMAAAYIRMSNESIDVTRNLGAANIKADTKSNVTILSLAYNHAF